MELRADASHIFRGTPGASTDERASYCESLGFGIEVGSGVCTGSELARPSSSETSKRLSASLAVSVSSRLSGKLCS